MHPTWQGQHIDQVNIIIKLSVMSRSKRQWGYHWEYFYYVDKKKDDDNFCWSEYGQGELDQKMYDCGEIKAL